MSVWYKAPTNEIGGLHPDVKEFAQPILYAYSCGVSRGDHVQSTFAYGVYRLAVSLVSSYSLSLLFWLRYSEIARACRRMW